MRRAIGAVLAAAVAAGTGIANAQPAVPAVGSPCAADLADAFTQLPDGTAFLNCGSGAAGYQWQPVSSPFDPSDRWLSYGPELTLHGQGQRNPEVLSGQWIATPQDPATTCGVEQAPVTDAGVGAPQTTLGQPGAVLRFEVLPVVFTITLTGDCLWERVS